jgi:hypothetical protein
MNIGLNQAAEWLAEKSGWRGFLRGFGILFFILFFEQLVNSVAKNIPNWALKLLAWSFAAMALSLTVGTYKAARIKNRSRWWAVLPLLAIAPSSLGWLFKLLYLDFFLLPPRSPDSSIKVPKDATGRL